MLKEFFTPNMEKIIIYMILIIFFVSEIFIIRYFFHNDNIALFILNLYENISVLGTYTNYFTLAFFFYIFILIIIYLLSCCISLIARRIKK